MSSSHESVIQRGPPIQGQGDSYASIDPAEPLHPAYPLPFLQGYQATMYRDLHTATPDRTDISFGWLSMVVGGLALLMAFVAQPVGLVLGIATVALGYKSIRRREGYLQTGPLLGALAVAVSVLLWGA
jgi:hypothetical protein